MNYIDNNMSEVTLEQFHSLKKWSTCHLKISEVPTPCLFFWNISEEILDSRPEMANDVSNRNPIIFDDWLLATYEKEGVEYFTIGPIERGRFQPSWLIDPSSFEKGYCYFVKII